MSDESREVNAMADLFSRVNTQMRKNNAPRGKKPEPRPEMVEATIPVIIKTRGHGVVHGTINPKALETADEIELLSGKGTLAQISEDQTLKRP